MTDPFNEIERIAPLLDELPFDNCASLTFSLVCDALVWSDELPKTGLGDDSILRYLLRYRTSVVVGQPEAALRPYWDAAKKAFPRWPGFKSNRSEFDRDLKQRHEDLKATEMDLFKKALG